ncbi:50S ribosomal protein L10, partial [Bacteroidota bacterium]
MILEEKNKVVDKLTTEVSDYNHFYLADISDLNAEETYMLRKNCHNDEIKLVVVKNTLLKRALEKSEGKYDELFDILKGSTSIMFSNVGNKPARLIKEFRKKYDRPILKGAYVEESVYIGEDQLETLSNIKSKEELIGDIIMILQSPVHNVISSLKSGSNIL